MCLGLSWLRIIILTIVLGIDIHLFIRIYSYLFLYRLFLSTFIYDQKCDQILNCDTLKAFFVAGILVDIDICFFNYF
jgi:hypothetical protein